MKIEKIKIDKFRSIEKSEFFFPEMLAIVGANNSGKSAILRALNSFFHPQNEIYYYIDGSHDFKARTFPSIELVFKDISQNSILKDYVDATGMASIRQKYYRKDKTLKYYYIENNRQKDLGNDFIQRLRKEIDYIYIPVLRDHSNAVVEGGSILLDLIDKYLEKHTQNRDHISPKVKNAGEVISSRALKKVSNRLNQLYFLKHDFELTIDYKNPLTYKDLLGGLRISIKQGGDKFGIENVGSGVQSLVIIAIYRFLSEIENQNVILGLEEPEMNLHPQAQIQLVKAIKQINPELGSQVAITTHSTVIVDQLEHENILLCRCSGSESRSVISCFYQIIPDFWSHYNIDDFKYYQFMKYKNSDFFFSNLVIIVEGKTDKQVVKKILNYKNIDVDISSISILELSGVKSYKYPFHLLNELKIPFITIVDKDFFLPYLNGSKNNSRNVNEYFKYKYEYKTDNPIIHKMITKERDKRRVIEYFKSNHGKALDILEKYNIICFRWNLEMDLIVSEFAKQKYYTLFNVATDNQTDQELLVNNRKAIKKPENLLPIMDEMPPRNLPLVYRRIRDVIINKINELNL